MGLELKIGRVSGNWLGFINLQNVEFRAPWLPAGNQTLFTAKSIQFRYRFLDFLSKTFDSKLILLVDRPEIHLMPIPSLRSKNRVPILQWMKEWAFAQRRNIYVEIKNLKIVYDFDKKELKGIDARFDNNRIWATIPLDHLNLFDSDITTTIEVTGEFTLETFTRRDFIRGEIKTNRSVVNWSPLPWEFNLSYAIDRDSIEIESNDFLGGMELTGRLDVAREETIRLSLKASNYAVSNLAVFFKMDKNVNSPIHMDLDLRASGNFYTPLVQARARVYDGWVAKKAFKALEINLEGIYPTVKMSGSRILIEGGQTMRLADKTFEISELFHADTYKVLVSEASQDNVVLGDWEFSRPKNLSEEPDFVLKKLLGDNAKVHFRRYNESQPVYDPDPSERKQVEVGLEYKLQSKDSLKVELRENEEIVGVERKLRF